MNKNNSKSVKSVLRPAGSTAVSGIGPCTECGCRATNLVQFTDGTSGYACKWNGHVRLTFGRYPSSMSFS